jgi:hypothetical protein
MYSHLQTHSGVILGSHDIYTIHTTRRYLRLLEMTLAKRVYTKLYSPVYSI